MTISTISADPEISCACASGATPSYTFIAEVIDTRMPDSCGNPYERRTFHLCRDCYRNLVLWATSETEEMPCEDRECTSPYCKETA